MSPKYPSNCNVSSTATLHHDQYFKAQKTGHIAVAETHGISSFRVLKNTFKPNVLSENNSYVL
jgi:hypothetical protein